MQPYRCLSLLWTVLFRVHIAAYSYSSVAKRAKLWSLFIHVCIKYFKLSYFKNRGARCYWLTALARYIEPCFSHIWNFLFSNLRNFTVNRFPHSTFITLQKSILHIYYNKYQEKRLEKINGGVNINVLIKEPANITL